MTLDLSIISTTIDNDRELTEKILSDIREEIGPDGLGVWRMEELTETVTHLVYRRVCIACGVIPLESSEWLTAKSEKRNDFLNTMFRNAFSSPADDTSGEWRTLGDHYLGKVLEEYESAEES